MNRSQIRLPVLAFLLAIFLSGPLCAAPESRTYTLGNRPAQDVAQQLGELYPKNQLATSANGQQLILRGEPGVLDEVGLLVETMDVAPIQLRVTVRNGAGGESSQRGGGVTVRNNQVSVQAGHKVTSTRSTREQNLVVQDGQSAHISSGQVRAMPVAFRGGDNPAQILQQVDIRSGFLITPRVISDRQVELNIMAFDNTPQSEIPGYETEAVMTIRRVEPGQWVRLGGTESTQSEKAGGITYDTRLSQESHQAFEVRVDLL